MVSQGIIGRKRLRKVVWTAGIRNRKRNRNTRNGRIHADIIVYIFAHLHTSLRKEGSMLDTN